MKEAVAGGQFVFVGGGGGRGTLHVKGELCGGKCNNGGGQSHTSASVFAPPHVRPGTDHPPPHSHIGVSAGPPSPSPCCRPPAQHTHTLASVPAPRTSEVYVTMR